LRYAQGILGSRKGFKVQQSMSSVRDLGLSFRWGIWIKF